MKKIYIMVSYTGTILSNLIRMYTGKEYTHVSISLDIKLHEMYSFGRIHPYNAFVGGFVREGKNFGTFKRFKKTKAAIYSIEVEDDQYVIIRNTIYDMYKELYQNEIDLNELSTENIRLNLSSSNSSTFK